MFALSNIVMKGNSKSWSLSHSNKNSIKDFTLNSCMVKGKRLIHHDYLSFFDLLFRKITVKLTEIILKWQFKRKRVDVIATWLALLIL